MALLLLGAQAQGQIPFRATAAGIPVNGQTPYGNVTGRYSRVDGVNRFYGIPIAAPTGGTNRFREPQTATAWTTALDASQTRSCFYIAPQGAGAIPVGFEDCLSIDVVSPISQSALPGYPTMDAAGTYPVHVWFHGGGFELEETAFWQGNDALYAGASFSHLPNNGRVVGCFIKYRISILGGMSHPALRNNIAGNQYSGSWQMYDALNGLRWIQSAIGNYGGNAGRVTISGQSAGATLSGVLISSPLAYSGDYTSAGGPLITGAIMHSMWQTAGYGATYSQLIRDQASASSIVDVGCSTTYDTQSISTAALTTIATCLRSGTAGAAEAATLHSSEVTSPLIAYIQVSAFGTASRTGFDAVYGANTWSLIATQSLLVYPVVDGRVMTQSPVNSWASGVGSGVSVMLGHTIDDDGPFWYSTPLNTANAADQATYLLNIGFLWGIFSNPAMNATIGALDCATITLSMPIAPIFAWGGYSSITDAYQLQVQQATDGFFSVNHNVFFDTLAAQSTRTPGTLYRFLYAEPPVAAANAIPTFGAAHMYDLTYAWGLYLFGRDISADNYYPVAGQFTYSAAQIAMGTSMNTFWSNFMVTGTPNLVGDGLPTWSPITTTEQHSMVFQSSVPGGAILDPCAMFAACYAEPTAAWRRTTYNFWRAGFVGTAASAAIPTCSPVTVGPTHLGSFAYTSGCSITVTPPTAAVTLGGSCLTSSVCATGLTCRCVAATGSRRSLLFGMPSSTASTECYCL